MAAFFVVVAILVGHTVGYLLHAENGLVELSHPIPIFSHYGDMPQFRQHDGYPPFSRSILFKDGAICQQSVNDRANLTSRKQGV